MFALVKLQCITSSNMIEKVGTTTVSPIGSFVHFLCIWSFKNILTNRTPQPLWGCVVWRCRMPASPTYSWVNLPRFQENSLKIKPLNDSFELHFPSMVCVWRITVTGVYLFLLNSNGQSNRGFTGFACCFFYVNLRCPNFIKITL